MTLYTKKKDQKMNRKPISLETRTSVATSTKTVGAINQCLAREKIEKRGKNCDSVDGIGEPICFLRISLFLLWFEEKFLMFYMRFSVQV